jgi:lactoylglutathione lyase
VIHFGMWVDHLEESDAAITAAGGAYLTGRQAGEVSNPDVYYEVKYTTPEGFVFDITETGWKGAVKDVVPAAALATKP